MWWKIYFWITIFEAVFGALSISSVPGVHVSTQIVMVLIFLIAVVGMYAYAFGKKILSQVFWQYFIGIYVLIDLLYLVYTGFPHAPVLSWLSFLATYSDMSFVDALIGFVVDIPLIYALYRLTKDFSAEKTKKVTVKDEPYRWGMILTAIWGYSTVLVFYLLLIAAFPSNDTTVAKDQTSDPYFIAGTFAPLIIFWLWIVLKYKEYRWNWWRTTLAANGVLYSGMIFWGIAFPQKEQAAQVNLGGIDIFSLLQLLIMLLGLWVFGRTQFARKEK